jgi:hypothetical protein
MNEANSRRSLARAWREDSKMPKENAMIKIFDKRLSSGLYKIKWMTMEDSWKLKGRILAG